MRVINVVDREGPIFINNNIGAQRGSPDELVM